jgi:hypothetical protein
MVADAKTPLTQVLAKNRSVDIEDVQIVSS